MFLKRIEFFALLCQAASIEVEPLDPDFERFPTNQQFHTQNPDLDQPSEIESGHFWNKLTTTIVPDWTHHGEIPAEPLRLLLNLIDGYFTENDGRSIFPKKVLSWASSLDATPEEVKCLFGQRINIGDKKFFFIEILVSCLQNLDSGQNVDGLMLSLARWLCQYDASLIGKAEELKEIYTELNIGPAFDIIQLQIHVNKLLNTSQDNARVDEAINLFLARIRDKEVIDLDIMMGLSELFRLRQSVILQHETNKVPPNIAIPSYLDNQTGINAPWISLAKKICGAGLLPQLSVIHNDQGNLEYYKNNFYRLLMDVTHDVDPITLVPLDCIPSADLILSHDGRYLIRVENSITRYRRTEEFYNPVSGYAFTPLEIARLSRTKHYLWAPIAQDYATKMAGSCISQKSVEALVKLVEASTFLSGFLPGEVYTPEQLRMAGEGYQNFCSFFNKLPKHQQKALQNQPIEFLQVHTTFGRVLRAVEDSGCIAGCGQIILVLILNYVSEKFTFNPEVERIIALDNMRKVVKRKKTVSEHDCSNEEAKRRLLIIITSLMSYNFRASVFDKSESIAGCSNWVVTATNPIFLLLNQIVNGNKLNFHNARYVYTTIIQTVEDILLSQPSINEHTKKWFQSIYDGVLFKQAHAYFEPGPLLAKLLWLVKSNPSRYSEIEKFLGEFLVQYAQRGDSLDIKALRVNIKFAQFLESQNLRIRNRIIYAVTGLEESVGDSNDFTQLYTDCLIHCLAVKGAPILTRRSPSNFFSTPQIDLVERDRIAEELAKESPSSVDRLLEHLQHSIKGIPGCSESAKECMKSFLRAIMKIMKPSDRARSPLPDTFFTASAAGPAVKIAPALLVPTIVVGG